MDRRLVVVANRLPVSRDGDRWVPSAGGMTTALRPVMERRPGAWVGWDGGDVDVPTRVEGFEADLHPVRLDPADVDAYYGGFANRTLWPLFHDLVEVPVFDHEWWEAYRRVNERIAEAAEGLLGDPAVGWVHDYHLLLVPGLLRERRPEARISFFLHIPWPPPELFSRLPWREELLWGILGADVVSFHTDRYRKNFARTCGRVLEDLDVAVHDGDIVLPDGREVRTLANPASIDVEEFTGLATTDAAEVELAELREQFEGRRVLLGVDRLDYTKGILERLQAFELLLERRVDLRGQVTLVQIAVPSREAVHEYQELRGEVEQAIGRINGRFTQPGGDVPIHYLHRGVPRERLVAYYRLADTLLVTALKDGMNLVAKEYVVCQAAGSGDGALVLSEFTGAALELRGAVRCNPFDIYGLSRRIEQALELGPDERRRALKEMDERVRHNDVHRWVDRELDALEESRAPAP